jgi:hypothetical protein
MFEEEILLGDTERGIALETREGTTIRNVVAPEPGEQAHRRYAALRKKFGEHWNNRKGACGGYNCFGMVFATRRTAIYDDVEEQVPRILKDDGYRQIPEDEVRPGDIVLYRERSMGLLHAAVVLRCKKWEGSNHIPFVLSKWNDVSGEDEHNVRFHCWTAESEVVMEFWTERPA